jgi:DNA-binding response OmpR family regulator
MNLLFIEPDERFFLWMTKGFKEHTAKRAATILEAEEMLHTEKFDACFMDIGGQVDSPAVVIARARIACNGTPLIILTGREVRGDLFRVCDGFMHKPALTHPEIELPSAAKAARRKKDAAQPMDGTLQLFDMLASLRHGAGAT